MAFKMNRPIIKGTANHKASIAKATSESIVAQTRTQANASLFGAADMLGKSFSPKEIEYGTNMDAFKVPKKGDDKKKVGKKKKKKEKTRKENLKEEYSKDFPDGTLFPNDDGGYQYYDADGKLVSNKVYDKDGNEVKKQKKSKVKKEKDRIQAEKDAAYVGKGEIDDPETNYKNTKEYKENKKKENKAAAKTEADRIAEQKRLATLKAQEDRFKNNKLDITSEVDQTEKLLQSIDEKKGEDIKTKPRPKEIVRSNIITEEDIAIANEKAKKAAAYDPEDERVYTKEDRERLKFDERTGEMRLPEEIAADKTTYTEEPVVEEKKTLSKLEIRKKKAADKKWNDPKTGQYVKDQMLKEGYVPNESKSPMDMRDNRIYRNAIKGGAVRRNMIKSGYIPE